MRQLPEGLENLKRSLPEFLEPSSLVELGIAPSLTSLWNDRKSGKGIAFIRLSKRRVVYPRSAVIAFLTENYNETKM